MQGPSYDGSASSAEPTSMDAPRQMPTHGYEPHHGEREPQNAHVSLRPKQLQNKMNLQIEIESQNDHARSFQHDESSLNTVSNADRAQVEPQTIKISDLVQSHQHRTLEVERHDHGQQHFELSQRGRPFSHMTIDVPEFTKSLGLDSIEDVHGLPQTAVQPSRNAHVRYQSSQQPQNMAHVKAQPSQHQQSLQSQSLLQRSSQGPNSGTYYATCFGGSSQE